MNGTERTQAGPRQLATLACCALAMTLQACATRPATQPVASGAVTVRIAAARDVNPDARGRPSPVVVRTFALSSPVAFLSADYFGLFERERETLGTDLTGRAEAVLVPGEVRELRFDVDPTTQVIGIVAGFRDLERSVWRATIATARKARPVAIEVERAGVFVRERRDD